MKTFTKKNKRRYNATYRLRKKGFRILTTEKTCYIADASSIPPAMKMLQAEYHFGIQLTLKLSDL